jgi:membrane protein DedA with SNARE-associated domain
MSQSTELTAWSGLTLANLSSFAGTVINKPHNEQELTMLISLIGLVIAVLGFVYTVWKGERSHKLQLRQFEQNERLLTRSNKK